MKIMYFNGAIDVSNILKRDGVRDAIQRIFNAEETAKNIEKLKGHNVYSVRINRADRLLFTVVVKQGKSYLVLLDYVDNHQYDKSKFLKRPVLKNFLEGIDALLDDVSEQDWQASDAAELNLAQMNKESKKRVTPAPVEFFNQNFIELSEEQKALVLGAMPAIVKGPPGSGKSSTALAILNNLASKDSAPDGEVLYVTMSQNLVDVMESNWNNLPVAHEDSKLKIRFKSYKELLHELQPSLAALQEVTSKDFEQWFKIQQGNHAQQKKSKGKGRCKGGKSTSHSQYAFIRDAVQLRTEFNIISSYAENDFKDYLESDASDSVIGKKYTEFTGAQRKMIVSLYNQYLKWLQKKNKVDLNYITLLLKERYGLVIVDESQDFSTLALKLLLGLAKEENIYYCIDNEQSLHDRLSKQPHIKRFFTESSKELAVFQLSTTYRSPISHINLANLNLRLKHHLLSGLELKDDYLKIDQSTEQHEEGGLFLFDAYNDDLERRLKQYGKYDVAIIAPEEIIEEAKTGFPGYNVFTIDQVKGLEFKIVVLYRPLTGAMVQQINSELKQRPFKLDEMKSNQTKYKSNFSYVPFLNQFHTAITRSTKDLVLLQSESHENRNLYQIYKDFIKGYKQQQNLDTEITPTIDESQYFKRACDFIRKGLVDQARNLLSEINYSEDQIARTIGLYQVSDNHNEMKESHDEVKSIQDAGLLKEKQLEEDRKILNQALKLLKKPIWKAKDLRQFEIKIAKVTDVTIKLHGEYSILEDTVIYEKLDALRILMNKTKSLFSFALGSVFHAANRIVVAQLPLDAKKQYFEALFSNATKEEMQNIICGLYRPGGGLDSWTSPIRQAFDSDPDMIPFLIYECHVDPGLILKRQYDRGMTSLMFAVAEAPAAVPYLLQGCSIDLMYEVLMQEHDHRNTALQQIVERCPGMLDKIFEKLDPDQLYELFTKSAGDGWTLWMVLADNRSEMLPGLLTRFEINQRVKLLRQANEDNWIVLMDVADKHPELLADVLAGIEVDQRFELLSYANNDTWTALMMVSVSHALLMIDLLKDFSADQRFELLSHAYKNGQSVLMMATKNQPEISVELLKGLTADHRCKLLQLADKDRVSLCAMVFEKNIELLEGLLDGFSLKQRFDLMNLRSRTGWPLHAIIIINHSKIFDKFFPGIEPSERLRLLDSVAQFGWKLYSSNTKYQDIITQLLKNCKLLSGGVCEDLEQRLGRSFLNYMNRTNQSNSNASTNNQPSMNVRR